MLAFITVAILIPILMPIAPAALVALARRTARPFRRRGIGRRGRDGYACRTFGGLRSADIRARTIAVTAAPAPMFLVGTVFFFAFAMGGLTGGRRRAVVRPLMALPLVPFLARAPILGASTRTPNFDQFRCRGSRRLRSGGGSWLRCLGGSIFRGRGFNGLGRSLRLCSWRRFGRRGLNRRIRCRGNNFLMILRWGWRGLFCGRDAHFGGRLRRTLACRGRLRCRHVFINSRLRRISRGGNRVFGYGRRRRRLRRGWQRRTPIHAIAERTQDHGEILAR